MSSGSILETNRKFETGGGPGPVFVGADSGLSLSSGNPFVPDGTVVLGGNDLRQDADIPMFAFEVNFISGLINSAPDRVTINRNASITIDKTSGANGESLLIIGDVNQPFGPSVINNSNGGDANCFLSLQAGSPVGGGGPNIQIGVRPLGSVDPLAGAATIQVLSGESRGLFIINDSDPTGVNSFVDMRVAQGANVYDYRFDITEFSANRRIRVETGAVTEKLILAHTAGNQLGITVANNGLVGIGAIGSAPGMNFSVAAVQVLGLNGVAASFTTPIQVVAAAGEMLGLAVNGANRLGISVGATGVISYGASGASSSHSFNIGGGIRFIVGNVDSQIRTNITTNVNNVYAIGSAAMRFSTVFANGINTESNVTWDCGGVTVAAAVPDATRYLNAVIGGVAVKIVLAV